MKNSKKVDLGNDPVRSLFFMLSIPAIASQVVNALYNMVDRMYIGHIDGVGGTALTGVGICFPVVMVIAAFAALIGSGGAPRASILMGKDDQDGAENILGNCFAALLISSIIITVVVIAFQEPILMAFGASENTIGYASDYMFIYSLGTIFVMLTLGLNVFISAQGFSKISMLTVVIGAITNIILDPILIFVLDLGVKGAALATVLSQAISCIWVVSFLAGKKTKLHIRRKYMHIQKDVFLPCVTLGVAPFIMQSTESLIILCFNSSLLKYGGDPAVGAMTILGSVMQFALLPVNGFTQGAQPIISFNYGARKPERMKAAFKLLITCCFTYTFIMWGLCMLFPRNVVSIFAEEVELINLSAWALRIYMGGSVLMGIQMACQQTFIALGNAKTSTFLALYRKILILIPLIFILPIFIENKVFAVFLAEPIADIIAVLTTMTLFFRYFVSLLQELDYNRM